MAVDKRKRSQILSTEKKGKMKTFEETTAECTSLWCTASEYLRATSAAMYQQWFACVVPLELTDSSITLGVPDDFFADMIRTNAMSYLEDALLDYDGTLLFVSHDRYFIRKIATSILKIEDGTATYYPYSYDEYLNEVNPVIEPASFKKKSESKPLQNTTVKPRKPSPSDMKKMEAKIEAKELELEELRELRFEPEYYQNSLKMQELDHRIDDLVNEVANLMTKWEEMMEMMEQ